MSPDMNVLLYPITQSVDICVNVPVSFCCENLNAPGVHKFSLLFSLVAVSSSQRSMGDLESLVAESKAKISALIQKPKMAEKLLSKPPFRFLHDTITAISVATGFAEGLYADAELDAAAMTDKNAKTAYLDKIFLLVGICKVRSPTITLHQICFISFNLSLA